MIPYPVPPQNNRIGFHYFQDSLHYRESDLQAWLPELRQCGASWLALRAPSQRAIPEAFLNPLIAAGIEPVLQFSLALNPPETIAPLPLLFQTYARWGLHYIQLFELPNTRQAWSAADWAQVNLVDRFLDSYLPVAECALAEGLLPIFPALQPGGDYWDLAFLRSALQSMQRRKCHRLLDAFILGAKAWAGGRPLNWGAGGPERWPAARPYFTPAGVEDQLGFRAFEWYLAIVRAELGENRPVLLFQAGSQCDRDWQASTPGAASAVENGQPALIDGITHAHRTMTLVRALADSGKDREATVNGLEAIPQEVLGCHFWQMAGTGGPGSDQAWYQPEGVRLPVVSTIKQWAAENGLRGDARRTGCEKGSEPAEAGGGKGLPQASLPETRPIEHYLLLPLYAWGAAEWELEMIQPFLMTNHPTVGFSVQEALLAKRVTVISQGSLAEETLQGLKLAGCQVEFLRQDGTVLAPESVP